ncbi:MAG TPA: VTT domain-containing protein [Actinomycetota bacterium]|nr:VTT domain-containing protein [Actinomycetota bacterium]
MKLDRVPKAVFLWLAVVRVMIGLAAIPLAPFLYREHFVVLVLMRPTKEVLLAAGFLIRGGDVGLVEVVVAAIPLMILGVWQFFYLGRRYCDEIDKGEVPGLGRRVLDPGKITKLQKVLDAKGSRLVFLGRLAAFSSATVAAAAGACNMRSRDFLPYDVAGAIASAGLSLGAGFLAGEAYESAGPWLTAVGLAALMGAAVLLGRYIGRA